MTAPEASEVVEKYWPLAMAFARRWAERYPFLHDEFRSEAAYSLWQSAVSYPSDNPPVKLTTWLHKRLRWDLSRRLATERSRNPVAFQERPVIQGDDEPLDLLASLPAAEVAIDAKMVAEELIATLPERYRGLVRQVYFEGVAVRDLAIEAGITESAVHQTLRRAIRKMAVAGGES